MQRVRVIVILGLPASGKSRLARRLAERYRVPLLAKDALKEPLLDVLGGGDRAHSRALSDASFAGLFAVARELTTAGVSCILEGNFRPEEHSQSFTALAASGVELHIAQVLCQASYETRRARLLARQSDPTRHPGHGDRGLADVCVAEVAFLPGVLGARWVYSTDAGSPDDPDRLQALLTVLDQWHHGPPAAVV